MLSLAILLLVLGTFGLFFYPREMKKQGESIGWPSVEERFSRCGRRLCAARTGLPTLPPLTYEHHVGGKHYRGSTLSIGGKELLTSREYDEKMAGIHPGRRVPVFYDPGLPHDCALSSGIPAESETDWLYLFSFFLPAAGLLLLLWDLLR